MPTPCFFLSVNILGYDAEVFLNGAPIITASRTHACYAAPPVSEWMVQGENTLSVVVHGGELIDPHIAEAERRAAAAEREARIAAGEEVEDEPSAEGDGDAPRPGDEAEDDGEPPPNLRVSLCRGIIGEIVDEGTENELIVLQWTPPPVPPEDEPLFLVPHEESEAADLAHPWGTWAWEAAAPFDLQDPAVVAEVGAFLRTLTDGLAQGDLAVYIDAAPLSYDEVAPCYDVDAADARARLGQAWPEITQPAGWALAPFAEEDLDMRLCCDGRVIEPRNLAGAPILRQEQPLEDVSWSLPIFLAKIEGTLQIVR